MKKARIKNSWIDPTIEWFQEDSLFAVSVPQKNTICRELFNLIVHGFHEVQRLEDPPDLVPGELVENMAKTFGLTASLSFLAIYLDEPGKKENLKFHLNDIRTRGNSEWVVILGTSPPRQKISIFLHSKIRDLAFELWWEEIFSIKQVKDKNLEKFEEDQELQSIQSPSFLNLETEPSNVLYVESLPSDDHGQRQCVIDLLNTDSRAPARDGVYRVTKMKAFNFSEVAIIEWEERGLATPALEIKSCLLKRRPSVCYKPALKGSSPPDKEIIYEVDDFDDCSLDDHISFEMENQLAEELLQDNSDGEKLIRASGFEAFGWYQAFHKYEEGYWGIYLDANRLDRVTADLGREFGSKSVSRVPMVLAANTLFGMVKAHEMFHAKIEFMASFLELSTTRKIYLPYSEQVYKTFEFTSEWREESLANWMSYKWLLDNVEDFVSTGLVKDKQVYLGIIEDWLDFSPPGYREWKLGANHNTWDRLSSELHIGKPLSGVHPRIRPLGSLLSSEDLVELRLVEDVPLRIVGAGVITNILWSGPSRKELVKILKKYGYSLIKGRGKGSHDYYQGPDGRGFTVPQKNPVSGTVFSSLLEHFGWSKGQYMDEIRVSI